MQRKPTAVFVYLLGAYVLIQFCWWGYHLIELTKSSRMDPEVITNRVVMIIGEGSVFLLLLLLGLWKIKSSIRKEIAIARQQNNFMLSVTHELKTPIAATKLYLQTMQKHELGFEKRNELMGKAIDETNRLENLVEQLLTASRLEQQSWDLQKETFSISPFLQDLIVLQEKRCPMQFSLNSFHDFQVTTDRFFLTTILNNLIENAYKYAFTEKGIVITVSRTELYVSISVSDFGKGIPEKDQKSIFQKFVRLQNEETRTHKGTGLGLFIAFQSTKALGGNLALATSNNLGTTFEIQIPYE
jgi:signal transduction histidine kinase